MKNNILQIIATKYGGTEVLEASYSGSVELNDKEIRIEVHAAGVNFADILIIKGRYQERPKPPFSPGLEISGIVTEIGAHVSKHKLGDHVIGIMKYGGYANEVVIPAENAYSAPKGMDHILAAGFPVAYGTAYGALIWKANIQEKESCVILGAAGGVGLAAVEIAKNLKAKVVAVAGSKERLNKTLEYGANYTINYNDDVIHHSIKKIFSKGVDVVIDMVGGTASEDALKSIGWNGRIVSVGYASGTIPKYAANRLLLANASAHGFYWGELAYKEPQLIGKSFERLSDWYIKGLIKPYISKIISLKDATQAIDLLKNREVLGKIVLDCKL